MGRQLLAGTLTMNALLVLSIFVSLSLGQASAECPEPTIGNCSATDYRCDLGFTAGCWKGDYCMPEGSICPMICNTPAPSNCSASEVVCDMGSYDGCWNGDYCAANGTVCPPVCHDPMPSQCKEGELTWDITVVAGLEISATRTRMDSSVHQFATGQLTLSVKMARFSATWVLMPIIAGWETTVCQPDPNVQPLQEFNQIPDVSI